MSAVERLELRQARRAFAQVTLEPPHRSSLVLRRSASEPGVVAEVVTIYALDLIRLPRCDADVVVDHQLGKSLSVDGDDSRRDGGGMRASL